MEYLSEEEQYSNKLSSDQKKRIKDPELRAIRLKYSDQILKNHADVERFDDIEVQEEWRRLLQQEKAEIEAYKKSRGLA